MLSFSHCTIFYIKFDGHLVAQTHTHMHAHAHTQIAGCRTFSDAAWSSSSMNITILLQECSIDCGLKIYEIACA